MLVVDWLHRVAEHRPDRIALVDIESGRQLTYAQLNLRASQLARLFTTQYELKRGDRVAILSHNRPEYLETLYACAKAGLILVCLNWRLAATELVAIAEDCTPSLLLHEEEFAVAAAAIAGAQTCPLLCLDDRQGYEAVLSAAEGGAFAMAPRSSSDTWHLLYTSGTTGRPKGVLQTFGMVYVNAVNTLVAEKVAPGDIFLNVLPFFHTGGLNLYTNPILMTGGTVLIQRRFDPATTIARLATDVTSMFAVPAIYLALAQHPDFDAASFETVRNLSVGGAPVTSVLGRAFAKKGITVAPSYGMTEAGPTIFASDLATAASKPLSVGKPVGSALIRIVGADGAEVQGSGYGELLIGGPVVTPGYWNQPEASAEAIQDGWLRTGDIAHRDDAGDVFIVDRLKDMYISGGENVYPAEIENLLYSLSGVAEAAVVGVPDERWGEVGAAIIVAAPQMTVRIEDVIAACREGLARYKIPQHVRLVESLPRTPSGKVEKYKLRALFADIGTGEKA